MSCSSSMCYVDSRLKTIEIVHLQILLDPTARHDGEVVRVVLRDDAPGEEDGHAQLILKSRRRMSLE